MLTRGALVGRDDELGTITSLLDDARAGGGGLLIRGEAGMGKSSLIEASLEAGRARGLRTVVSTGVRGEANLPFAGLHQLLRPLLDGLPDLPLPQRGALTVAFGLESGPPCEPFLVGLAALSLLGDAAGETPVLVAVDDVQWLDAASADALAFVARRLGSDPIVLIAAIRDGETSLLEVADLQELQLTSLDDETSRELLDHVAPDLSVAHRVRVLGEAAGNPLALVELARVADRLPAAGPDQSIPLSARLERAFAGRWDELQEPARTLLLVAALDDGASVTDLVLAARALGMSDASPADLEPAAAARLIDPGIAAIAFRHPLVRSAIQQTAAPELRRTAHQALAGVHPDPDRAAWHRAAAAEGPDEDVALALEEAADRAIGRGAISIGVAALERAAQLSPSGQTRASGRVRSSTPRVRRVAPGRRPRSRRSPRRNSRSPAWPRMA